MKSSMYYDVAGCSRCSRLEKEILELKAQCAELDADNIRIHNNLAVYRNSVKKETAKEIIQDLLGYIGTCQQFCIVNDGHKTLIDCDKLFGFIEELAKKYGVVVE